VLVSLGASVCCTLPLVLLFLGIGGAWMVNLTALAPYQPIFVIVTLAFLGLAFRNVYFASVPRDASDTCATPSTRRKQRAAFWGITVLVLMLLAFPWYAPWIIG
jgi:mercuric ion transport protein